MSDASHEHELRRLAHFADDDVTIGKHVDEPILALLRDGDQAEDLNDAIAHVARCADCRARLTEGNMERRSLVVMAIEAPRASQSDLQKVAEDANARLVERGEGRFMAVVDADKAEQLQERLEQPNSPDSSVVTRIAVGTPFEVPVEELRAARERMQSIPDLPAESGTDAAEVQAWAQVARKPSNKVSGVSAGWVIFAALAIAGAIALAYMLATR